MYLLSSLERKLFELDENKNIVNEYEILDGVSEISLSDGKVFDYVVSCVVTKNENGDIVEYEKVFFDVREYFVFQSYNGGK